jgi:hypothetical protein
VFPDLSSIDIPFSSYPLKAKYVELMGKDKGYNSSLVPKFPQMILERVFEMVWWRGRKWAHTKKIFEVEMFFSSQNIDFPILFAETLGDFLFPSSLFFNTSLSPLFSMLRLFEDLGILMINEEKHTLQKNLFLDEMEWNG